MAYQSIFSDTTDTEPSSVSTGYKSIFNTPEVATPPPQKTGYQSIFGTKTKPAPTTTFGTIHKLTSGGAFNLGSGGVNQLINTGHTTYGGVPTKSGYERADIVPVSLGGSNQTKENITYEPYSTLEKFKQTLSKVTGGNYIPQTDTDKYLKNTILPQYKAGKISLTEARINAISYLQDKQQGLKQGTLANYPSAVVQTGAKEAQGFIQGLLEPFGEAVASVKNALKTTGAVIQAIATGKKTVPDYSNESLTINFSQPSYFLNLAKQAKTINSVQSLNAPQSGTYTFQPMFTGKESPAKTAQKVVGNALEIAPYFIGAGEAPELLKTLDVVGNKPIEKITTQELGQFVKAYGAKVAASALPLGTMFGLGGGIKEATGDVKKDVAATAVNVVKSIGVVALMEMTLGPIMKYGTDLAKSNGGTLKDNLDTAVTQHEDQIKAKAEEIKTKLEPPKTPFQTVHEQTQAETPAETTVPAKEEGQIVAVARHGSTDSNGEKVFRGWDETPQNELTDKGKQDAVKLGESVKETVGNDNPKDYVIVSSDLQRAVDSAKTASEISGVPLGKKYFGLRSQDTGDYTGLKEADEKAEIQQHIEEHPDEPLAGASESHNDFVNRVKNAFEQVKQDNPGKKIIVVTHHQVEVLQANDFQKLTDAMFDKGIEPGQLRPVSEPAKLPIETPKTPFGKLHEQLEAVKPKPEVSTEGKVAGIAKSIQQKAVDAGVTKGYENLAKYEPLTWKDQFKTFSDIINNDFEKARSMIRGEEPLPAGKKGIFLIAKMEEYIEKHPEANADGKLSEELVNSPIATEVSEAAQTLGGAASRTPDSATLKVKEIQKAIESRSAAAHGVKDMKEITQKAQRVIKAETEKVNLTKEELHWDNFLKRIAC